MIRLYLTHYTDGEVRALRALMQDTMDTVFQHLCEPADTHCCDCCKAYNICHDFERAINYIDQHLQEREAKHSQPFGYSTCWANYDPTWHDRLDELRRRDQK